METNRGMYIKLIRTRLGLKQKDLAQRVGIMNHRLSEYERGRRNIPPKVLTKIHEALIKAEEERLAEAAKE